MSKENENNNPTFEGLNPPTLFREFAAECMELAQTAPTPEKRSLYMKMASLWHQMAQRWERGVLAKSKKTLPRCPKCNEPMRAMYLAQYFDLHPPQRGAHGQQFHFFKTLHG